ncbi:peptidase U32 [Paludibacter propionicigenes WB4]|uniref:Peptidase U32 n=1 Tax=Paludibacter propionicigenes (strain DSM 17365 / JCM 13257 / WB4) TaxID=694427 RepID=E4T0X5_PALPW|nr:U32 family peptidase [Paludibacter propionicigenes]ADQ78356.1 peptidase U32 [Paludibacter propionicigenes WB4]
MRKIELLSPAKNLECGLAAINHGADAVYIGASQFGARAAAGNSVEDIATLVQYAHKFRVKVLVALNTILTDDQLTEAEKLIWDIYNAGADALIIQDMGILKLNLPPIALHASTQTDNRTVEKVKFLQDVGFSRVVLARELSLKQITEISTQTDVELEAFVHGALCVSYSGQCYMSQANCERSANRGQCAQYCRLPYQLTDADDNLLAKNKHLLSLKDLDLSDSLDEMMEAGVSSFKIEGRLKDVDYVKNITAYYRKRLDAILDGSTGYQRASAGRTTLLFEPNPEKSFRRSNTDYFLHGRKHDIVQQDTPKSLGEPIGKVTYIGRNFFEVQNGTELNNGDGLCFINKQGDLTGFRVNRVERKQIFPADIPRMDVGVFLYRNQDQAFEKILKGKTSERRVGVEMLFGETPDGFFIQLTDEDGISNTFEAVCDKQPAQKPEVVNDNIKNQLSKLGNTIYEATDIQIQINSPWFFPASQLSEWRRQAIEQLDEIRTQSYVRETALGAKPTAFPTKALTYLGNVTNKLSEAFYKEHGVEEVMPGFEVKAQEGVPLMFCKHCIKFNMGWCPKEGYKATFKEPLYLRNNDQVYELSFDCKACEMRISKSDTFI